MITGTTDFDSDTPSVTVSPATYASGVQFAIAATLFGTSGGEAGGVFQYRGHRVDNKFYLSLVGRLAMAK